MTTGSEKILYIDDDADDLHLFSETLSAECPEYDVLQAPGGEEGLSVLKEMADTPCLVILDMNMPRIDGLQILKRIRQNPRWERVPVVLFTTAASDLHLSLGRTLGASFVTKPMSYETLKETAKILCGFCRSDKSPGA